MPANNAQKSSTSSFPARRTAIAEQDVAEGLDRACLNETKLRFLELNAMRTQRLRESLLPTQQIFLELLPLLFHVNHASLPGYVADVPCGIANFKVGREHVKAARSLAKSFALQRDPNAEAAIAAVYLMGSCGSLAHNNRSDIDIWLCTTGQLTESEHAALQKKCTEISTWAATLKIEAHFFIMHDQAFRDAKRAPMDVENCGRTQHYLLLDELYRTLIVAAGNMPLWWMVPDSHSENYSNYTAQLLEKRHVNAGECTDFGAPSQIPAAEFISAGVWQLYKGISSPYKALLKLMLIEAYAADPSVCTLSAGLKQRIYQGDYQLDELDPYLQVYRRVEQYLQANEQPERLELARRCLYFKVGVKLSQAPDGEMAGQSNDAPNNTRFWRRNLMQKLVAEWGWRRPQLRMLDESGDWSFNQIVGEQQRLTRELVQSYRLLSTLAKRHQEQADTSSASGAGFAQDTRELNILGRQLYAIFEQKPHKVTRLAASLAQQTEQEQVHLALEQNAEGKAIWTVQLAVKNDEARETVKRAESPAELLVWCLINGLVSASTRFSVEEGNHQLTDYEIRQLCSSLASQLPCARESDTSAARDRLAKPARHKHCIFIANCGVDPLKEQRLQGTLRVSAQNDPLSYSGVQENLVASITLITVNSWQETFCYHFQGERALNDCLTHYLSLRRQSAGQHGEAALPPRSVLCACPTRPGPIASRLESLLDDIEKCYFADKDGDPSLCEKTRSERRYVFQSAYGFHVLGWHQDKPAIELIHSEAALLEHLSNPDIANAITIDSYALQNHPLSTICRKLEAGQRDNGNTQNARSAVPNRVRVFYVVKDGFAETYLTDQRQSICYAKIPYESTRALILPLRQFVERSSLRRAASGGDQHDELASFGIDSGPLSPAFAPSQELPDIEFFALQQNAGHYTATLVPTEANISAKYMPIKAVGSQGTDGKIDWVIHCNDELFDGAILGESLFTDVAASIKKFRRADQPAYRCYINDIEVHRQSGGNTTLVQDFYYKNKLEDALNNAFSLL